MVSQTISRSQTSGNERNDESRNATRKSPGPPSESANPCTQLTTRCIFVSVDYAGCSTVTGSTSSAPPLASSVSASPLHVVERLLDRFGWVFFGVFALVCAASLVVRARAKPFWHDEIYTILHAGLPSVGAMWQAALDGIDLSPPLNTWLTRLVHSGFGVGHVATRIPPMAAYLVMTATVFQLLRTRANTATALAGAMLPAFTAAFRYSY